MSEKTKLGCTITVATLMVLTVIFTPLFIASQYQRAQIVHIVDGDTITVLVDGAIERVRYIGVNAPEYGEDGGPLAATLNTYLVGGYVNLVKDKSDRDEYGRLLRYVYNMDGNHIGCELVKLGVAEVTLYPPDTKKARELLECQP